MRKFTKSHNDIQWLFPNMEQSNKSSEQYFDMYESIAEELFKLAHQNKTTFTKDDVIDAFMKGASIAHSRMINVASIYKTSNDELKRKLEQDKKQLDSLYKLIEDLSTHYKK